MSFSTLGLRSELLQAVSEQGYKEPTPIQLEAIPAVLTRRDVMAVAQTGTGKTASFALPILQALSDTPNLPLPSIRALVVTPTRELAAQVATNIDNYCTHINIKSAAVYGGVRIEPQVFALQQGVDVLVATPGRLLDLYTQEAVSFDCLEILVLDEADRMLDLGFLDDIRKIQSLLPSERQTLMFSATFSKEIKSLAKGMLQSPILIELADANTPIEAIAQTLHPVDKSRKGELLIHLIKNNNWHQILVFIRTKREADILRDRLEAVGISAESIHANRTQRARTLALDGFKGGTIKVLVATDIASRGIDISHLPCVINFDLPFVPEDYVHRIGRTGRASANGIAISLFSEDETKQLKAVERHIGKQFSRELVPGFTPTVQAKASAPAEDLYGNFEADTPRQNKPTSRGKRRRK